MTGEYGVVAAAINNYYEQKEGFGQPPSSGRLRICADRRALHEVTLYAFGGADQRRFPRGSERGV